MSSQAIPGEITPPSGPFWASLDPTVASTVAAVLTPQELDNLKLDPSASNSTKLNALETALAAKLSNAETSSKPSTLHSTDYNTWKALKSSLFHVHKGLGNIDEQEKILLELVNNPGPGPLGRDLAALHNLSALYEETGQYKEAESNARKALTDIQAHSRLGKDTPQALGSLRVLIKALWKQGKVVEAKEYVGQAQASISNLAGTPFAKFQQEETDALGKIVAELN
ncbi:Tetratricopeptide repeat [Aspergillus mulundensis]|uniref:Tetratricopeptide repeat n=1 Tax=Aspergillus mulundensis TaxID=1810919 RepID=A0A3D8R538_9EURO|nr:Tetratricopeptide repeat [Aspergillus mulundensis]RDW69106.1 Tetratricopeptide repeat [Aspergillus mulundensis]